MKNSKFIKAFLKVGEWIIARSYFEFVVLLAAYMLGLAKLMSWAVNSFTPNTIFVLFGLLTVLIGLIDIAVLLAIKNRYRS